MCCIHIVEISIKYSLFSAASFPFQEELMIELHTELQRGNGDLRPEDLDLLKPQILTTSSNHRQRTVMFDTEYFIASSHDSFEYNNQ